MVANGGDNFTTSCKVRQEFDRFSASEREILSSYPKAESPPMPSGVKFSIPGYKLSATSSGIIVHFEGDSKGKKPSLRFQEIADPQVISDIVLNDEDLTMKYTESRLFITKVFPCSLDWFEGSLQNRIDGSLRWLVSTIRKYKDLYNDQCSFLNADEVYEFEIEEEAKKVIIAGDLIWTVSEQDGIRRFAQGVETPVVEAYILIDQLQTLRDSMNPAAISAMFNNVIKDIISDSPTVSTDLWKDLFLSYESFCRQASGQGSSFGQEDIRNLLLLNARIAEELPGVELSLDNFFKMFSGYGGSIRISNPSGDSSVFFWNGEVLALKPQVGFVKLDDLDLDVKLTLIAEFHEALFKNLGEGPFMEFMDSSLKELDDNHEIPLSNEALNHIRYRINKYKMKNSPTDPVDIQGLDIQEEMDKTLHLQEVLDQDFESEQCSAIVQEMTSIDWKKEAQEYWLENHYKIDIDGQPFTLSHAEHLLEEYKKELKDKSKFSGFEVMGLGMGLFLGFFLLFQGHFLSLCGLVGLPLTIWAYRNRKIIWKLHGLILKYSLILKKAKEDISNIEMSPSETVSFWNHMSRKSFGKAEADIDETYYKLSEDLSKLKDLKQKVSSQGGDSSDHLMDQVEGKIEQVTKAMGETVDLQENLTQFNREFKKRTRVLEELVNEQQRIEKQFESQEALAKEVADAIGQVDEGLDKWDQQKHELGSKIQDFIQGVNSQLEYNHDLLEATREVHHLDNKTI